MCSVYSIILTMLTFLLGSQATPKMLYVPCYFVVMLAKVFICEFVRRLYVGDRIAYSVEVS